MPPSGEPQFYRSVIRSDARLTYGEARAARGAAGDPRALDLNDELARELRAKRFARGALQVQTPEIAFRFDGDGGVADAWLEGEPHAHMLVEELMVLANELVGAFLSGRRREALYRVHERPDPQAVERLLAKLVALGVPTPPVPERMTPQQAAGLAGAISEQITRVRRAVGPRARGVPGARAARAQAGAVRPEEPRALRSRKPGVLPTSRRRSGATPTWSSTGRCCASSAWPTIRCRVTWSRSRSTHRRASATRRRSEYLADEICLAWLLDRRLFELGWETVWSGEIIGLINSGLFCRFGDVFEGFLPARRLHGEFFELNELGTALAGRTHRPHLSARRPARRARRVDHARARAKVDLSLG